MLRSIAEQKLKLFRTIDSLGQKELYEVEKIVTDYLEKKMKEKESLFSLQSEPQVRQAIERTSEVDGFWKNVEEINESKQLSAFQNVHDSLLEHPLQAPVRESQTELDAEQMLSRFRHLNLHAGEEL